MCSLSRLWFRGAWLRAWQQNGPYDRINIMGNQQDMLKCKKCGKMTLHTRTTPNTLLHIFLSIITAGVWLIVWILFIGKGTPKCMTCGKSKTLFG